MFRATGYRKLTCRFPFESSCFCLCLLRSPKVQVVQQSCEKKCCFFCFWSCTTIHTNTLRVPMWNWKLKVFPRSWHGVCVCARCCIRVPMALLRAVRENRKKTGGGGLKKFAAMFFSFFSLIFSNRKYRAFRPGVRPEPEKSTQTLWKFNYWTVQCARTRWDDGVIITYNERNVEWNEIHCATLFMHLRPTERDEKVKWRYNDRALSTVG